MFDVDIVQKFGTGHLVCLLVPLVSNFTISRQNNLDREDNDKDAKWLVLSDNKYIVSQLSRP